MIANTYRILNVIEPIPSRYCMSPIAKPNMASYAQRFYDGILIFRRFKSEVQQGSIDGMAE